MCLSFVAVVAFAQDEEQDKEIVTTDLEEVIVSSGVIDVAKERVTPIAFSTIPKSEIELKAGNQFIRTFIKAPVFMLMKIMVVMETVRCGLEVLITSTLRLL